MDVPVDHLVYATPDLDRGMMEIEQLTGVVPTMGGRHAGRGTRNALISLGDDAYLEIIAPDPDQPPPAAGRWLGVDAVTAPRLVAWAISSRDLSTLRRRAIENGAPIGEVRAGERQGSDGMKLSWHLTDPDPLIAEGLIPFLIDWGDTPHPSRSAAQGATLAHLHLEHPDVASIERILRALDLNIAVTTAKDAAIVAVIDGRHGRIELR